MAKDREVACKFYTYEGGPCAKRGISTLFTHDCQTCKDYCPIKNGKPRRPDIRRKKLGEAREMDFD